MSKTNSKVRKCSAADAKKRADKRKAKLDARHKRPSALTGASSLRPKSDSAPSEVVEKRSKARTGTSKL